MNKEKNLIAAILLTFLFGPIGLFYATIWGGIIMTLLPIILAYISLGELIGSVDMPYLVGYIISTSLTYFLIMFILYWPACILWSAISVIRYNKRIGTFNTPNIEVAASYKQQDESMIEWLKSNPGKSINDYYASKERF